MYRKDGVMRKGYEKSMSPEFQKKTILIQGQNSWRH